VLVTGGAGFIGAALCRALVGVRAHVHAVSRGAPAVPIPGVRWWQHDLTDVAQVRELFERVHPQLIFHLAGSAAGARRLDLVLPTFHNNLTTTVNLLTTAAQVGCERIVVAGSLEEPPSAELNAIPSSPYAISKWAGSAYARMFHALFDTPVVLARVFMVYGPGRQTEQKLLPHVIQSLLRGDAPALTGGERPIDWVYVDDVAEGLLQMCCVPGLEGRTIDLGSGELVTVRRIVEQVVALTGATAEPAFGVIPDRPMEQVRVADAMATLSTIGWKARTTLEEGLRRTIDWYAGRVSNDPSTGSASSAPEISSQQ
jgi:nucleoside-diphosphate-sugar epimerase